MDENDEDAVQSLNGGSSRFEKQRIFDSIMEIEIVVFLWIDDAFIKDLSNATTHWNICLKS